MASSLIQQKKGANTSTTALAIALTSNTVTGDTIVVAIIGNTNVDRISGIAATGCTFAKVAAASGLIGGGAASYLSVWMAENVTGAATPTITISKSLTWAIQAVINHYRGLATTSLDKTATATGTTTAISGGTTATLSQAAELIVMIGCSDFGGATYTVGSGYGNLNQQSAAAGDLAIQDKVVAATTAVTGAMTLSGASDNRGSILALKVDTGGGPATPTNLFFGMM